MRSRLLAAICLSIIALSLSVPAYAPGPTAAAPAPSARPNIVFILADDLDARSVEVMPKLKSLLAERGATFSNYFVTYALCCPSRSSILRGQYPHNTQVLSNRPPLGGFEKFHEVGNENSTVGTWLQAAGYRTAYMGKYLNGYPNGVDPTHVPPGWDEWDSPSGGNPYSHYNYRMNENGKIVTYIFFSSDNGFHLGEHRLPSGKNTAYEEDIRVPLIVVGPGVPEGRVVEHMALNIDLGPTWAELAGGAVPAFVDGRSLVPVLNTAPPSPDRWRQAFLVEHYTDAPRGRRRGAGIPEYHAMRTKDYIYVEYATGERELYDLRRDPFELQNLAATTGQSLLAQLASRLGTLKRCGGANCRSAEDASVPSLK